MVLTNLHGTQNLPLIEDHRPRERLAQSREQE
jgi:hypothetical protein